MPRLEHERVTYLYHYCIHLLVHTHTDVCKRMDTHSTARVHTLSGFEPVFRLRTSLACVQPLQSTR